MSNNTETSKNLTEQNTKGQLTLFQPQTLASPSVLPGSEEARQMTVSSGRRLLELYEKLNRPLLFSRMFMDSLIWGSRLLHLTWRAKGTKSNRLLFQLFPLGHGTDETDCGLLPIATAMDHYADKLKPKFDHPTTLAQMVKYFPIPRLWRTPMGADGTHNHCLAPSVLKRKTTLTLSNQVKIFPTPQQHDHKVGENTQYHSLISKKWIGGQLNPTWVEWLMGYPEGWTDLNHSETQ